MRSSRDLDVGFIGVFKGSPFDDVLQALFADLAVEGGAADAEPAGDFAHVAGVDFDGQLDQVARRLGIGRSTLYRKVRENGLEDMIKGGGQEAAA